MAGVVNPIVEPQRWHTARFTVGTTELKLVKPAAFKIGEQATVMIQASNSNAGTIYMSSVSGVTTEGATVGFELKKGEATVLPIGDIGGSEIWLIGTNAGDDINVSFFNGGNVC